MFKNLNKLNFNDTLYLYILDIVILVPAGTTAQDE